MPDYNPIFEYHYNDIQGVPNVNMYLEEWGKQGWRVHTISWEYPPPHLSDAHARAHILMERVSISG